MANRLVVFCLSTCVAAGSVFAAESTWTGGSGNWSEPSNWEGDHTPPVAGDTAVLGSVDSGTRTVTMDQADAEIQQLRIEQQTADAVNKFVLGDDLRIDRTVGNLYKPFDVTTVATNAVQVDLDGHAIRIDGGTGYGNTEVRLDGWWTLGSGSLLDFVQNVNQNAQEFINDGRLDQTDSEISYRFVVLGGHNTTQNGWQRRWVNNGTWTMDHALFSFDARLTTGSGAVAPGGFGYLNNCENNGTLVMLNGSTNTFATLTNNGLLDLRDQSAIGTCAKAAATIRNGATGELRITGSVRTASDETANAIAYLSNRGRMAVGTEEVAGAFDFRAMSASFTNETAGTLAIASNSTFTVGYSGIQGVCLVANEGTIDQRGDMFVDFSASANNNGTRKFSNSGVWKLRDGAVFSVMSSSGLTSVWGFNSTANVSNTGRIEIGDGACMGLNALSNYGTLTMASNACLGVKSGLTETRSYVNCGVIDITEPDAFIGQSESVAKGNNTAFDQNAAPEGSEIEPLLAIGTNDTDEAGLSIAAGTFCTVKFNAGTVKVGAKASLMVTSQYVDDSQNLAVEVYNNADATIVQKGTIGYRPHGSGAWSRFYNYGTWTIDATDESPARIVRGLGGETYGFGSVFYNYGVFGGRGTVVFSDVTGRTSNNFWLLTTYGGADLVVGEGGLRLTDGQIKFAVSGEAVPRIVYDMGATADGFGGLTIDGDKGVYEQQKADLAVVLKFPKKVAGWGGRHTLRLVTAPNVGNNNRISSVTAVYDDGTPADDIELGTPVYGSTTIDLDIKVRKIGLLLLVR